MLFVSFIGRSFQECSQFCAARTVAARRGIGRNLQQLADLFKSVLMPNLRRSPFRDSCGSVARPRIAARSSGLLGRALEPARTDPAPGQPRATGCADNSHPVAVAPQRNASGKSGPLRARHQRHNVSARRLRLAWLSPSARPYNQVGRFKRDTGLHPRLRVTFTNIQWIDTPGQALCWTWHRYHGKCRCSIH